MLRQAVATPLAETITHPSLPRCRPWSRGEAAAAATAAATQRRCMPLPPMLSRAPPSLAAGLAEMRGCYGCCAATDHLIPPRSPPHCRSARERERAGACRRCRCCDTAAVVAAAATPNLHPWNLLPHDCSCAITKMHCCLQHLAGFAVSYVNGKAGNSNGRGFTPTTDSCWRLSCYRRMHREAKLGSLARIPLVPRKQLRHRLPTVSRTSLPPPLPARREEKAYHGCRAATDFGSQRRRLPPLPRRKQSPHCLPALTNIPPSLAACQARRERPATVAAPQPILGSALHPPHRRSARWDRLKGIEGVSRSLPQTCSVCNAPTVWLRGSNSI